MIKASFKKYILHFHTPSGTSRGVMTTKETWFLFLEKDDRWGVGECGLFRGLSYDDRSDYSDQLQWVCEHIHLGKEALWEALREWPSLQFGVEQAFLSLESQHPMILFPSLFTASQKAIPINGLIWMGEPDNMRQQIKEKIQSGFSCIKLKIGAIAFEQEWSLLEDIRRHFSADQIEIRVDANGGFDSSDALCKLIQLNELQLHSIEQPVKKGATDTMAELCAQSPLPIALDEELIGVTKWSDKENLLRKIMPQYIILKPSLVGGFKGCEEWIALAEKYNIGWWITSALESNIGLNAIAQWTFTLENKRPQGLGTGGLFTNNFPSSLMVENGHLWMSEASFPVQELLSFLRT